MSLHVIVLAAGKGTRMESDLAKVLHEVAGRRLIEWMISIVETLHASNTVVVVGHQAELVTATLPDWAIAVRQEEQLGTAHATEVGLGGISPEPDDVVLVLPGDMPLIGTATLEALLTGHETTGAAGTVLSAVVDDPTGYGRVIRQGGDIVGIVEHVVATAEQRTIREVNTSVYAFGAGHLADVLGSIEPDLAKGERYLTDAIGLFVADGHRVGVHIADALEGMGVNTAEQLAEVQEELLRRTASR